jgi:hypothetical protein
MQPAAYCDLAPKSDLEPQMFGDDGLPVAGLVVEEVDERNCVEHDEVGHLADGNGLGTRDRRLSGH